MPLWPVGRVGVSCSHQAVHCGQCAFVSRVWKLCSVGRGRGAPEVTGVCVCPVGVTQVRTTGGSLG